MGTRMGFRFSLYLKTERFGMAFQLLPFVRSESEHNSSHPRLYWSEPESGFRSFRSTASMSDVICTFLRA